MNNSVLVDTDILIDYLRDHEAAVEFLESLPFPIFISSISVAELYTGVREGEERGILESFIDAFDVISADTTICKKGGLMRRDFRKSAGISIADAIIAATAETKKVSLASLNRKHFSMVKNLIVPYSK